MLSARGDEEDRIVGLEVGADDYLVKPFSPRELVLRIEGLLRRDEQVRQANLLPRKISRGRLDDRHRRPGRRRSTGSRCADAA